MGVELRVLGPLELVGADGIVALPRQKLRRLLVALALADGRTCSTDALVEALWGEVPPASARKLLQVYVSQLRKALPEGIAIVTKPGAYALDLDGGSLDAEHFERLVGEAAAALEENPALAASLAERARAIWRGPAYAEVMYDDFAHGEVERLDELLVSVTEHGLDAQLRLGEQDKVLPVALALADQHPLRERLHELAMLALYRSGRQADALDRYAELRRRLDEELGLEPGPKLRELQRRILQQDATLELSPRSSGAAGHGSLPATPNQLVGRSRELDQLDEILSNRNRRLLVLTGAGGSGKTRLALEATRRAAPSYANGAVLVELGPLRDAELVLPTIAQTLGIAEVAGQATIDTLTEAIRSRELLLVLDNAEHLRQAAPRYAELVARAPRLTLLVTSRAVLHVSGEQVFPVAPLDEVAAVELFEQRARALVPSFEVAADNEADVREICRRVDCLPLAVELAAARIPLLTPGLLLGRLSERLRLLTSGAHDLPARQQTLRETLDWSADLLGRRERHVLARLAVFPSGATIEAAEAICGADIDVLATLVDHSLVRRIDVGSEPRFGLLETIREYAYELLGSDRASAEAALLAYLCALFEPADLNLAQQPLWMARIDAEIDNLRAALEAAARHDDRGLELQLAGRLWRYWWVRGQVDEGIARIEVALAHSGTVVSHHRARALHGLAGLAWSRGDYDVATERATEAIEVARATGSLYEEAAAHTVLGTVANARKDFDTARHHHRRSIALAEQLGVEPAAEKLNLAIVALDSGDSEGAAALFEDVLAYHRRNGIAQGIGFATINLGLARYRLGSIDDAVDLFVEAQNAFAEVGFRVHVAHALQGRAACEVARGRHETAARLLGEAARELGEVVYSEDEFPLLAAAAEAAARDTLGNTAFDDAYAAGQHGVAVP